VDSHTASGAPRLEASRALGFGIQRTAKAILTAAGDTSAVTAAARIREPHQGIGFLAADSCHLPRPDAQAPKFDPEPTEPCFRQAVNTLSYSPWLQRLPVGCLSRQ
jgi:hypothetical protein